jgi:hypothetical protein
MVDVEKMDQVRSKQIEHSSHASSCRPVPEYTLHKARHVGHADTMKIEV